MDTRTHAVCNEYTHILCMEPEQEKSQQKNYVKWKNGAEQK